MISKDKLEPRAASVVQARCSEMFSTIAHGYKTLRRVCGGRKKKWYKKEIIDDMWKIACKLRDALKTKGFELRFAQSTYHSPKRGCGNQILGGFEHGSTRGDPRLAGAAHAQ